VPRQETELGAAAGGRVTMGQLTTRERDLGAIILIILAVIGIAMAAAGRSDVLGIHGAMVLLYSLALLFVLFSGAFRTPPSPARLARYYDEPIKVGVGLTLFWAIFGMLIGVWAAAQLAWPSLN